VLRAYADYYNRTRTHLSLNKDTPLARPILQEGRIKGGLRAWLADPQGRTENSVGGISFL
jgi:hypothetical protein